MPHLMQMFVSCIAIAVCAMAQIQRGVTGEDGDGSVNWEKRVIVARGIGAPNPDLPEGAQRPGAIRAAQMIALRNALETVKGIYMNSSTTVQNFMTTSDVVTTQVNGYLKNFQQKGREKYMSDGSVEVTMEIPIDGIGGIGDFLLSNSVGDNPSVTKFEGKKAKKEQIFTGLIIDCRGLKLKPALSPKVMDNGGKEIYGSAYVSKEWAVKYGIVGYAKTVDGAAKLERIGDKPGKIKAVKASGANNTDVIISNDDAADVRSAAKNLKFLSQCRVILVVD
ncbi:MAG: hypothetical protein GY869_02810 [Planctomycetes bacterium]|nr:hypothetical protein [Planctomycetota bacterium]